MKDESQTTQDLREENRRLRALLETSEGRDLTAQTQAAEQLREFELRFSTLADNISQFAWMADEKGWIFWYNRRWFEYTGTTLDEMQGWGWRKVHHPDHVERVVQQIQHSWNTGEPWEDTFPLRSKDGEYRWFLSRAVPIRDGAGKILRWFGTNTDITELKRVEEQLRSSEEFNRTVLESSPDAVKVLDSNGRLLMINRPGLRLLEIDDSAALKGLAWWDLWPEESRALVQQAFADARVGGTGRFQAYRPTLKGTPKWWDVIVTPVRNASGQIASLVSVSRDITESKRTENALKETDRKKDDFLAMLAHELRNPLAPLRTGLDVLKRLENNPAQAATIREMMERALNQTVRLVDDLLDVSRITRGKLQLRKEHVDLAAIVRAAVETGRPLIEEKQQALVLNLPSETALLDADAARLAQVIANLLSNAAKYSPERGQIGLTVACHGNQVEISVADCGIGISAADLPRVFDLFSQVDSSLEQAQGGLGIGLSLAKQLVEMHGGRIEARSGGVGRGSEFIVHLPSLSAGSPAPATVEDRPAAIVASKRILIVDDNRASTDSLAMLLESDGHQIAKAYDGMEALTVAESFQPEIVLLDIGMPKLNGYEVARRIRNHAWGKDLVLIAMSGWGQEKDQRRSRASGFDNHLIKPLNPEALAKIFATKARNPSIETV